jgi:hypothetical protein
LSNVETSLKGFPDRSDELVSTATSGTVSFGGISYTATSQNITGLLPPGSTGVNHGANPRVLSISGLDLISYRHRAGRCCRPIDSDDPMNSGASRLHFTLLYIPTLIEILTYKVLTLFIMLVVVIKLVEC